MQKRERYAWVLCAILAVSTIFLAIKSYGRPSAANPQEETAQAASSAAPAAEANPYEFLFSGTAWQLSAESQSLMMQAFTDAREKIDLYKSYCDDASNTEYSYEADEAGMKYMTHQGKRIAIITDIDDTLVDGAHYTANIIGKNGDFNNAAFARFLLSPDLQALPGAVEFINYCTDNGVEVFYCTNRSDRGYKIGQSDSQGSYESVVGSGKGQFLDKDGNVTATTLYQIYSRSMFDITLETMKRLGFPIDDQHLIENDNVLNGASKEPARQAIINGAENYPNGQRKDGNETGSATEVTLQAHDVVLLMGDNIRDFTDDFSASDLDAVTRAALASQYQDKWGTEWIVLPNAVYGDSMNYAMAYGFEELFNAYDYTNTMN